MNFCWPAGGLPKRRRGRTLAAAESARAAQDAQRPTAVPEDIRARASRFGAFRQAVRAADPAERTGGHPVPADTDDPHTMPSPRTQTVPAPSHPEGDTTS